METLIPRIKAVLNQFVVDEETLLRQDVHEEAITSSLLIYLRNEFADLELSIDTQYDKRILDDEIVNKTAEFLFRNLPLDKWPKTWEDGQEFAKKDILPDFIFHERFSRDRNFLIVELKKSANTNVHDRAWDHLKLKEMTRRDLNYDFGLFIDLKTGGDFDFNGIRFSLTLYEDGAVVYEE